MGDDRPDIPFPPERMRRILVGGFLLILGILLYGTIHHFVVALGWATILVLTCWPLRRWLAKRWPRNPGTVAFFLTVLLGLGILVPVLLVGIVFVNEARELAGALGLLVTGEEGHLEETARTIPLVGETLGDGLAWIKSDPTGNLKELIETNKDRLLATSRTLASVVTSSLFEFFVCMFATFSLFFHGDVLGDQIVRGVRRLGGDQLEGLMHNVRETVRAVVYGLVMTAIAQAIVAAAGFAIFGVPYPLLLGILMLFVSFIPFGPPVIWLPASLILLSEEKYWHAGGMFAYGVVVISTMDNIFRPLFIGQATKMSVLLVFFGVLGGIFSFGMIGLFVGPVVIAVTVALWRGWVSHDPDPMPQKKKARDAVAES